MDTTTQGDEMPATPYSQLVAEAVAYYDLCDRAAKLGICTDVLDPKSPQTVAGLVEAVRQAEAA